MGYAVSNPRQTAAGRDRGDDGKIFIETIKVLRVERRQNWPAARQDHAIDLRVGFLVKAFGYRSRCGSGNCSIWVTLAFRLFSRANYSLSGVPGDAATGLR